MYCIRMGALQGMALGFVVPIFVYPLALECQFQSISLINSVTMSVHWCVQDVVYLVSLSLLLEHSLFSFTSIKLCESARWIHESVQLVTSRLPFGCSLLPSRFNSSLPTTLDLHLHNVSILALSIPYTTFCHANLSRSAKEIPAAACSLGGRRDRRGHEDGRKKGQATTSPSRPKGSAI